MYTCRGSTQQISHPGHVSDFGHGNLTTFMIHRYPRDHKSTTYVCGKSTGLGWWGLFIYFSS